MAPDSTAARIVDAFMFNIRFYLFIFDKKHLFTGDLKNIT